MRPSIVLALAVAGLAGAASPSLAQNDAGWITLLDGTSLANWNQTGKADWHIAGGAAEADNGFGYLVSKKSYGDFELRAEFWVNGPANSGIFLRCDNPAMPSDTSCYEANIFDTRPDATYGTGAITHISPIKNMPKAANKWNTYDITVKGNHLVVVLNGRKTADVMDSSHARGPIALQHGAGVVKFRKVEIKPL